MDKESIKLKRKQERKKYTDAQSAIGISSYSFCLQKQNIKKLSDFSKAVECPKTRLIDLLLDAGFFSGRVYEACVKAKLCKKINYDQFREDFLYQSVIKRPRKKLPEKETSLDG